MKNRYFWLSTAVLTGTCIATTATFLGAIGTSKRQTSGAGARCEITLAPTKDRTAAIAVAIERAEPGCTIRLQNGEYKEIIKISKPISLVGDKGAVIDPSEPLLVKWEQAESFGPGVWRAKTEKIPASLLIDGKLLAQVNPNRPETQSGQPWAWTKLLASGPPRTGFRFIRGLWLYSAQEKAVLVHLENNADPSKLKWTAIWSRDPVITIANTHDASVRGVTLAHGYNGVTITGNCERCSVTHSTIGPWDGYGVQVLGGATESSVADNEIFRGAYEDWKPMTEIEENGALEVSKDWYEVWLIHKLAGFQDRVGVSVTLSGANNRVQRNRIHDVFDGINLGEGEIESLDAPVADPKHDEGTEISENTIERTADSGIEVGGPAVNVRIHDNVLRQSHGDLRYKLPRVGPVFIYRNFLLEGSPNDIWYSMDDSPAEGYVYHNTIVGGRTGLAYHRMHTFRGVGAPKWHYLNNLVVAQRGFFETRDKKMPVNFFADYNVVQGGGKPYPNDPTRDSHSKYVEKIELSDGFPPKPMPGSAAIDAGLDLSRYFHGGPLPGCDPVYFQGKAPDAGAVEVQ